MESSTTATASDEVETAQPAKKRRDFIYSRGVKFPKNRDFITGQVRGALRENGYERKESDAALRVVGDDDVVVELGAGIGYMSALLASKRKIKSVHAFEANPALIPYIKSVYALNGLTNAHVTNAILGPRKGKVDFHVRRKFIASSMNAEEGGDILRTESIEMLNANTVMKSLKPTVLICDIEGAEAALFKKLDLSGVRAVVIELHPQWIGQEGVQTVFDCMTRAGLTYWPKASESKVVTFRNGW